MSVFLLEAEKCSFMREVFRNHEINQFDHVNCKTHEFESKYGRRMLFGI